MGVDCFKTDFGERIPDRRRLPRRLRPGAGCTTSTRYLYNQTVFEAAAQAARRRGGGRVRALRHASGAALPRALGRRLRRHVRVDGARACAAACRSASRASASGATTSAASRARRRAPCTSAGSRSACCPRTAACTAAAPTACRGCSTRRRCDVLRHFTQLKCGSCRTCYGAAPSRRTRSGVPDDARR